MVVIPEQLEYALEEQIGAPELFVGRKKEFSWFLGRWHEMLMTRVARCQAIVARRKKGKSVFLQRLFNIHWTIHNPQVIPFYYSMPEVYTTQAEFSKDFLRKLISQLVAFETHQPDLVSKPVPFEKIPTITQDPLYLEYYEALQSYEKTSSWTLMWNSASSAPSEIANLRDLRIIQLIDEFQYINEFILSQSEKTIQHLSGSYLTLSEQRKAPLIVSGSEVHWLLRVVNSLVGRFQSWNMENLPEDEAKEAILRYAQYYDTKIHDQAIDQIWRLTDGDPLYIAALFSSRYNDQKDLTEPFVITEIYEKEMSPGGWIFSTWMEYMVKIFKDVNERNAKRIILYLFKQGRECTRKEIIQDLKLKDTEQQVEEKLQALMKADLIGHGSTMSRYQISRDKTYEWVFRNIFQEEITDFAPKIQDEVLRQMGIDNNEIGLYGEFRLRRKLQKGFNLQEIAENGPNQWIQPCNIQERVPKKLGSRTFEIDLIVESDPEIWIEVKTMKARFGKNQLPKILRLKEAISKMENPPILMVFASAGFTQEAAQQLDENGILYGSRD